MIRTVNSMIRTVTATAAAFTLAPANAVEVNQLKNLVTLALDGQANEECLSVTSSSFTPDYFGTPTPTDEKRAALANEFTCETPTDACSNICPHLIHLAVTATDADLTWTGATRTYGVVSCVNPESISGLVNTHWKQTHKEEALIVRICEKPSTDTTYENKSNSTSTSQSADVSEVGITVGIVEGALGAGLGLALVLGLKYLASNGQPRSAYQAVAPDQQAVAPDPIGIEL